MCGRIYGYMAGLNRKAQDSEARENILILNGVKRRTRRVLKERGGRRGEAGC